MKIAHEMYKYVHKHVYTHIHTCLIYTYIHIYKTSILQLIPHYCLGKLKTSFHNTTNH